MIEKHQSVVFMYVSAINGINAINALNDYDALEFCGYCRLTTRPLQCL